MQPIAIQVTRISEISNIYHLLLANGKTEPISKKAAKDRILQNGIKYSIGCIEEPKPKKATYYLN